MFEKQNHQFSVFSHLAYNQEYKENSTNKYVCVYASIWNSGDHSHISGVFFQFGTGGFNWEK